MSKRYCAPSPFARHSWVTVTRFVFISDREEVEWGKLEKHLCELEDDYPQVKCRLKKVRWGGKVEVSISSCETRLDHDLVERGLFDYADSILTEAMERARQCGAKFGMPAVMPPEPEPVD